MTDPCLRLAEKFIRNLPINTATTKKAALSLAILVSLSLMFTVSCGSNAQPPSGDLPIWKVGDTWTVKSPFFAGGPDLLWVSTVTGEQIFNGIDCYTLNISCMSYSTGSTFLTRTSHIDKSTLYTIEREDYFPINGSTYTIIETFSYNYSTKPYPYSVGKTWTIDCISNSTTHISGNISTRNSANSSRCSSTY